MLPKYDLWGIGQYVRLWSMDRWHTAVGNLANISQFYLLILCIAIGIILAILLDQKIRAEGVFENSLSYIQWLYHLLSQELLGNGL